MKLIIQKYFEKKKKMKKKKVLWPRSWQTFPVKGQIVNILDLEGHVASVAITQFWHQSTKAARDETQMNDPCHKYIDFVSTT